MNVSYTEEAIADIVEAITYLNERNPTAAAKLDAEISRCIERLAANEFDGPPRSYGQAPSCEVGRFRRSGSITSVTRASY